jgi:hypothetical protein
VAWIEKSGSNNDRATPGEWVFSWIDGGKAVQDVLTVPYRWRSPESDFSPMAVTSVRTFNEKIGQWEGFHLSDGRLIYVRVAKPERGGGQLMEHFTPEGGPLTVWVFSDISASSFIVKISESLDKGSTYRPKAELWAKKRVPALP